MGLRWHLRALEPAQCLPGLLSMAQATKQRPAYSHTGTHGRLQDGDTEFNEMKIRKNWMSATSKGIGLWTWTKSTPPSAPQHPTLVIKITFFLQELSIYIFKYLLQYSWCSLIYIPEVYFANKYIVKLLS